MLTDKLAYTSPLAKNSPFAKVGMGFLSLVICLTANTVWVSLTAIIFLAVASICIARVPFMKYIKLMSIPIVFLLLGTITIIIGRYQEGTTLLFGISLGGYSYGATLQSVSVGILLILRALSAVSCMYFISITTPMNDILNVLRFIRVPTLLVSLMELIYRYIFVILDEAQRMKTAQNSRLGYLNLKAAIRSTGTMLGALFLRVYMRCDRVYAALQSRGYEGELQVLKVEYSPSAGIILGAVILDVLLVLLWYAERVLLWI